MTAVKEQLVQMVPQMPMLIPNLTEEKAKQVYNIFITVESEKPKRDTSMRIGAGKGKFNTPDDFDANNEEIYAEIERYALS